MTSTNSSKRGTRWDAARQRQALDLSARYRHGAKVSELAAATGLSRATVLNRLHMVGTPMRSASETRRLRQNPEQAEARNRMAAQLGTEYHAGASVTALAARHGISARTVRRLLREEGTPMRSSAETRQLNRGAEGSKDAEDREQLRRWYESGVNVRALAAVHDCSTTTVYRQLKQAGAVMRPRGRTPVGFGSDSNPP